MLRNEPPNYPVDCIPTFVSPQDSCWDADRIVEETDALKPEDPVHPCRAFWAGLTRGDLEGVREYFVPDADPTRFVCRRLTLDSWSRVTQMQEIGQSVRAGIMAIRHGLTAVEDSEQKLTYEKALTDDEINDLRRLLGDSAFSLLGKFLINVSTEVTIPEGKP